MDRALIIEVNGRATRIEIPPKSKRFALYLLVLTSSMFLLVAILEIYLRTVIKSSRLIGSILKFVVLGCLKGLAI
jgi:hypothetical protein